MDYPKWFLYWSEPKGKDYVTSVCHWTKKDLIRAAERETNMNWKQIYKKGGRAIKVSMKMAKRRSAR